MAVQDARIPKSSENLLANNNWMIKELFSFNNFFLTSSQINLHIPPFHRSETTDVIGNVDTLANDRK